jgi:hypothetical protein
MAEEPLYETETETETEEEDAEDTVKPTDEEMQDLRAQMAQWVHLDDQMRKLSVAMRERRTQQRALGAAIQTFMVKFKYDVLNTAAGPQIKTTTRKVKAPLKLGDVRQKLVDLKGEGEGGELVKKIFDERPVFEKTSIRRIIPKVNMHLDL